MRQKSLAVVEKFVNENFHVHTDWTDTYVECNRGIHTLEELTWLLLEFINETPEEL